MLYTKYRVFVQESGWLLFSVSVTIVVTWLFTHSTSAVVKVGFISLLIKTILFFVYGFLWNHIQWGLISVDNETKKATSKRLWVKSGLWRLLSWTSMIIIVLIVTKQLGKAFWIGTVDSLLKFVIMYGYEKCWNHIAWGRIKQTQPPQLKDDQESSLSGQISSSVTSTNV